jgi:hypothetical protein
MFKRSIVGPLMGIALCAAGVLACGANATGPELTEQTGQALTDAEQSQKDATTIWLALLRSDYGLIPDSCVMLRSDLFSASSVLAALPIVNEGPTTIDGLPAIVYRIYSRWGVPLPCSIVEDAEACYPKDASLGQFLAVNSGFVSGCGPTDAIWEFDPGPLLLKQDLPASPDGAFATGTDKYGNPGLAFQWPSTCRANIPGFGNPPFKGGEACSWMRMNEGSWTSHEISKQCSPPGTVKCL